MTRILSIIIISLFLSIGYTNGILYDLYSCQFLSGSLVISYKGDAIRCSQAMKTIKENLEQIALNEQQINYYIKQNRNVDYRKSILEQGDTDKKKYLELQESLIEKIETFESGLFKSIKQYLLNSTKTIKKKLLIQYKKYDKQINSSFFSGDSALVQSNRKVLLTISEGILAINVIQQTQSLTDLIVVIKQLKDLGIGVPGELESLRTD